MISKNTDNTPVYITFITNQKSGEMSNFEENIFEGALSRKGESVYAVYKSEDELCSVKQTGNEVRFTRHGTNSVLRFKQGEVYDGFYNTPAGVMEMSVITNKLSGVLGTGETLEIDYILRINRTDDIHTKIEIKIEEK